MYMLVLSKYLRSERAVSMIEYVIGLVILIGVFIAGATVLNNARVARVSSSTDTENQYAPCRGTNALPPSECF